VRGLTIARVAAEAGVGVGTVSRVLNGSPSVSEDTRRRVLAAIATLDYQPSAVARALSTGRTHAVGVVAPFFTQPSVIERLRGISPRLAAGGYQLVLFDVERADQTRDTFRSLTMRGRVDGVLSISLAPTSRETKRFESAGTPIALPISTAANSNVPRFDGPAGTALASATPEAMSAACPIESSTPIDWPTAAQARIATVHAAALAASASRSVAGRPATANPPCSLPASSRTRGQRSRSRVSSSVRPTNGVSSPRPAVSSVGDAARTRTTRKVSIGTPAP